MIIVSREKNRHPVTVAFEYAIVNMLVSVAVVDSWKQQVEDLVKEVLTKFISLENRASIQEALSVTLGIMSLAIADATKGVPSPKDWAHCLLNHGPKGLARVAIEMVKRIPQIDLDAETLRLLEGGARGVHRSRLLTYARGAYPGTLPSDADGWPGYKMYLSTIATQIADKKEACHLELIFSKLRNESYQRWKKREESKFKVPFPGSGTVSLVDESILNTVFLRICLGQTLVRKEIAFAQNELMKECADYKKNPKAWVAKARKHFDIFLKQIPNQGDTLEDFRAMFVSKIEKSGPPNVPQNKSWHDSASEGELAYFYVLSDPDLV